MEVKKNLFEMVTLDLSLDEEQLSRFWRAGRMNVLKMKWGKIVWRK